MYLIIGGNSFIGVYTANEFVKQGLEVAVTGRSDSMKAYYEKKGIPFYHLDLEKEEDFNNLPKEGVEGVVLLAALLPAVSDADLKNDDNAADYVKANTLGTLYTLEYCRKNNIKRVIAANSYFDVKNSLSLENPLTEDEPRNFMFTGDHAAYVISKNAASDYMEYYNQQHGFKNAWFRLPPVYGVGPHGSLKINGKIVKSGLQIFMDKAEAGETIEIYGDGSLARDVVYVKDVAHAYYLGMMSDNTYGLYNIGSGRGTTLLEQAEVISELFKKDKKSEIVLRKDITNNGQSYVFNIEKAKRDFGYIPQYPTFEDMMKDYKEELERGEMSAIFGNRLV